MSCLIVVSAFQVKLLLLLLAAVLQHLPWSCCYSMAAPVAAGGGNFNRDFAVSWGKDHAKVVNQGKLLTLSLDQHSGSAFQSKKEYVYGKFEIQLKLVHGDSAGTDTSFYLSSQGSAHDEIDFEFLGNVSGEPYILHTNVFSRGGGGREQQFYLWFDPTADFHTYSILWTPKHIVLSVDDTPIRQFKNLESAMGVPYPSNQPMRVFGSLWNAEYWATRGGLVKTNWAKDPFVASYRNFNVQACVWSAGKSSCNSSSNSSSSSSSSSSPTLNSFSGEMDSKKQERMRWVQSKYMIYNYCHDKLKFPHGLPAECFVSGN